MTGADVVNSEPARPLGEIIRAQRRLARMSLRRLADRSAVSNPYLSQIERGLHEPSFRVLQSVADALDVSVETMLVEAGMLRAQTTDADAARRRDARGGSDVERAIDADERLSPEQKSALLSAYRGYVGDADWRDA